MYIFFDTETTGLPHSWSAPPSDVDNWPRLVQLAWQAFDSKGRKTAARSYLIRPDGFTIPKVVQRIHGISTETAKRRGVPVQEALDAFLESLDGASVLVAHNIVYDSAVVRAEIYRLGMRGHSEFRRMTSICTMRASTEYCAIPGWRGYKWPKLPELHKKLFGRSPREAHDAAKDVAICSKCFFELKRRRVLQVPRQTARRTSRRR
jgi:DNA polymerase-3 subunit epsilon